MKFRSPETPQAGFQLAPMIDIVFLLLIFFIVSWNYASQERELDVSVPTAEEREDEDDRKRSVGEIILNVKSDGSIVLNKETLTEAALLAKLQRIAEVHKDQAVILRGDKATAYQDIIRVLDTCQKAGIWNVAFATQGPEAASPQP